MFRNLLIRIRFSICCIHRSHASHFSATNQLPADLFDKTECSTIDWHLIPFPPHARPHPVSSSAQRYNSVPFSAYRFWWVFESLRPRRLRPFDWRLASGAEVDRMPRSNDAFDCVPERLLCAERPAIPFSDFSTDFSSAWTFCAAKVPGVTDACLISPLGLSGMYRERWCIDSFDW